MFPGCLSIFTLPFSSFPLFQRKHCLRVGFCNKYKRLSPGYLLGGTKSGPEINIPTSLSPFWQAGSKLRQFIQKLYELRVSIKIRRFETQSLKINVTNSAYAFKICLSGICKSAGALYIDCRKAHPKFALITRCLTYKIFYMYKIPRVSITTWPNPTRSSPQKLKPKLL